MAVKFFKNEKTYPPPKKNFKQTGQEKTHLECKIQTDLKTRDQIMLICRGRAFQDAKNECKPQEWEND